VQSQSIPDSPLVNLSRRDLARLALGAAAASSSARALPPAPWGPGIKGSLQIPNTYDDDYLMFVHQIGVEYVSIWGRNTSYEYFVSHKRRIESAGLKIANMGDTSVHNMPEVTLGLEGREAKIEVDIVAALDRLGC
jgi:mannonate dehydratase